MVDLGGRGTAPTAPDLAITFEGGDDVANATCSIDGCDRPLLQRGWCERHYTQNRRHGDPLVLLRKQGDPATRFWANVDKNGPIPERRSDLGACWTWTGSLKPNGYGQFRTKQPRRMVYAHRYAYELLVGPIPDGLTIDHLCSNRACVNVAHMEPVTLAENTRRAIPNMRKRRSA